MAQYYVYRLELMRSARSAFSIDDGLWSLVNGNFSAIRLDDAQSLEGILINLVLMTPVGYLLPMNTAAYGKPVSGWRVVLCGTALSAIIEAV